MKVFILGFPKSGKTTIAKHISTLDGFSYIDASSWIKLTFRSIFPNEKDESYYEEYHHFLTARTKAAPLFCVNNVLDIISATDKSNFIIDGLFSPKDLVHLFDVNKDVIVFLNRTDNDESFKDSDNIAVSVMRDYCYWLSSAGLLEKKRWIEYNFKIPGEKSDTIKELGSKNTVFIARSIDKVMDHLKELIKKV
ncbi:hypothetical protein UFOVP1290_331 [uncultured Caudovirales phage]|uniref:AAA domain containing protein n=1 Tax=uncultured Caudovirales phage TaxID=2100421 RepID=A0A6J5RT84_9CAUD|nr:hypothetical protein UFOVP1290_331 [uncultured Caudovirales phage]